MFTSVYWNEINGGLSDFWYWLNSNILVPSGGIIVLQKSLFSHAFLYSVLKEQRQFRQ